MAREIETAKAILGNPCFANPFGETELDLGFAFSQQQVDAVHKLGAGKRLGNVVVGA